MFLLNLIFDIIFGVLGVLLISCGFNSNSTFKYILLVSAGVCLIRL